MYSQCQLSRGGSLPVCLDRPDQGRRYQVGHKATRLRATGHIAAKEGEQQGVCSSETLIAGGKPVGQAHAPDRSCPWYPDGQAALYGLCGWRVHGGCRRFTPHPILSGRGTRHWVRGRLCWTQREPMSLFSCRLRARIVGRVRFMRLSAEHEWASAGCKIRTSRHAQLGSGGFCREHLRPARGNPANH